MAYHEHPGLIHIPYGPTKDNKRLENSRDIARENTHHDVSRARTGNPPEICQERYGEHNVESI